MPPTDRWTAEDLATRIALNPDIRVSRPSERLTPLPATSHPSTAIPPEAPRKKRRARGHSDSPDHEMITEEALGNLIRDACKKLGTWKFYWLRHTKHSSAGILDLYLVPIGRDRARRHILNRELKGYDCNGRLGRPTAEQLESIELINAAGGDAGMWEPADWFSDRILRELSA